MLIALESKMGTVIVRALVVGVSEAGRLAERVTFAVALAVPPMPVTFTVVKELSEVAVSCWMLPLAIAKDCAGVSF